MDARRKDSSIGTWSDPSQPRVSHLLCIFVVLFLYWYNMISTFMKHLSCLNLELNFIWISRNRSDKAEVKHIIEVIWTRCDSFSFRLMSIFTFLMYPFIYFIFILQLDDTESDLTKLCWDLAAPHAHRSFIKKLLKTLTWFSFLMRRCFIYRRVCILLHSIWLISAQKRWRISLRCSFVVPYPIFYLLNYVCLYGMSLLFPYYAINIK